MRRAGVTLAVALLLAARVVAAEVPSIAKPDPAAVAKATEAALAAAKAKDDAGLRRAAAAEGSDPWLVADALVGRGEATAAAAFARAAGALGPDLARLPDYVKRPARGDAGRRKALEAALAQVDARKWEEALAALGGLERRAVGGEDVVDVRASDATADAVEGTGRAAEAVDAAMAAGKAARGLGWLAQAGRSYHHALELANALGNPGRECEAYEALLAVAEERGDVAGAFAVRADLGDAYRRAGQLKKAAAVLERVRAEAGKASKPVLATALLHLGQALSESGGYEEAFRDVREALSLFEQVGEKRGPVAALMALGNFHNARGEFVEARARHEEVLARSRAAGDEHSVTVALGNLANDASKVGEFAKAIGYAEQALAFYEKQKDESGVAHVLGTLSNISFKIGDLEKAFAQADRARAISESLGDFLQLEESLGQLGTIEHARGRSDEALAIFERQRAIVERMGKRAAEASILANMGTVRYGRHENAEAAELLSKALAIQKEIGHKSAAVHTGVNLAASYLALGRGDDADRTVAEAISAAERLRDDDDLVYALRMRASLRLAQNRFLEAVGDAKRAIDVHARLVQGLGDEAGALARGAIGSTYEVGLQAAIQGNDAGAMFRFVELAKAGALREALGSKDGLRSADIPAELLDAEKDARAKEARAIAAYRAALEGGDVAEVRARRDEADAATASLEGVLDRIQRTARRASSLALPTADEIDAIKGRLAPNEALLTYSFGKFWAFVEVVTRERAQLVGIGKVEAIERNCSWLHADDPAEPDAKIQDALNHVGGHLVRRFDGLPPEIARVYVVPEGPIGYVPFTLLFPGREIVYEPSATTYGMLLAEQRPPGDKVLALGDPDYASLPAPEGTRYGARGKRLARLPATLAEAKAVGDVVLVGKDASEPGLLRALSAREGRPFRAVHFACHGLVDPEHAGRSALALTPSGDYDGYLTAMEVLRTHVPADMAVLSACETAKGVVVRGEGILGLPRAFMQAGTPRVVCSLWKVDDEATKALMVKFYERWKAGSAPARALLEAQDFVRSQPKWRHPHYWAAWVLWGLPS
jgi:tetratricopeptide (TPR) repeat protein